MLDVPMLKTLLTKLSHLTVFEKSAPRHKDVHFLHHRCYNDDRKNVQCH